MANLLKGTFPAGSGPNDFQCFGPAATKDGQFDGMMLADMGCFNQEGVDSNKYYHDAVVQHKTTGKWYEYREWGRTGASSPQFQFIEYRSKEEAMEGFVKQCHSKNDKRGEWVTVGGLRVLRAKKDKDCYLVRPQAKRSTGLPDARTITEVSTVTKPVSTSYTVKVKVDEPTMRLMRDLNMGTLSYTRSSMSDSALPTQGAIDDARAILGEAKKRLSHLGDDIKDQVADTDLKTLTAHLYGRIPKVKPLRAGPETWILNRNNVVGWEQDLDAFESVLSADTSTTEHDPFAGMDVKMEYVNPKDKVGSFIMTTIPKMTNNRNGYGQMRILNIWKVDHHKAEAAFSREIGNIGKVSSREKAAFQPERVDLSPDRYKLYSDCNCCLLFHGTRSVNVSGILKTRLRLPKTLVGVALNGAAFGPGAYFASDWQKSAGYCSLAGARWVSGSGGISSRRAFMFLVDVPLGNIHLAPESHGYTSAPKGYHSVMGKGGTTRNLVNDEHIVYNAHQQQVRYLLEFDAGRGF